LLWPHRNRLRKVCQFTLLDFHNYRFDRLTNFIFIACIIFVRMDQLIPVLNQLSVVLSSIGDYQVTLPAIIAIGSQSSGKSSVLENIVGR
jgi:hypothetical protein